MRPLVGISAWRRELDTYLGPEVLQSLSAYYSDAVTRAAMTPVILPAAQDPSEAPRFVSMVDGLLLSGGDDIDPSTYGAEPEEPHGNDPEADLFEIALLEAARSQNKPVLAICRGMQLLNVAFGGTLRQEVTSSGGIHDIIDDETSPDQINDYGHVVRFEPGSIVASIYEDGEAKVNTLHHQGIDRLAPGLIVEGRSDDGLIEALRWDGEWWALGVQWHPERMGPDHQGVFQVFRQALEEA